MQHEDAFIRLIAAHLEVSVSDVTPEASFVEDLGADSLDLVELLIKVEETFDIKVPDEDAEKLTTVQDAINYVQQRMSKS